MSEAASRRLFLAELLLFALPAIVIAPVLAMRVGGIALIYATGALAGVMRPPPLVFAIAVAVLVVTAAGLVGLIRFIGVSVLFWREGRAGLRVARREFWQGLAFGGPALALGWVLGLVLLDGDSLIPLTIALYAAGAALFVPIAHLWLELRSGAAPSAH